MKTFFTIFFSAFCFLAQAQVARTATQTILATNVATINLSLNSENIEIIETKGSRIIIETKIALEGVTNLTLLDFVISSGRYELINKLDQTNQSISVSRKKNKNSLIVKGEEVKENLSYKILVPETIKFVNTKSSATASIN